MHGTCRRSGPLAAGAARLKSRRAVVSMSGLRVAVLLRRGRDGSETAHPTRREGRASHRHGPANSRQRVGRLLTTSMMRRASWGRSGLTAGRSGLGAPWGMSPELWTGPPPRRLGTSRGGQFIGAPRAGASSLDRTTAGTRTANGQQNERWWCRANFAGTGPPRSSARRLRPRATKTASARATNGRRAAPSECVAVAKQASNASEFDVIDFCYYPSNWIDLQVPSKETHGAMADLVREGQSALSRLVP